MILIDFSSGMTRNPDPERWKEPMSPLCAGRPVRTDLSRTASRVDCADKGVVYEIGLQRQDGPITQGLVSSAAPGTKSALPLTGLRQKCLGPPF